VSAWPKNSATFSTRKGNTKGTVVIVPDPAIGHDRLREVVNRWTTAVAAGREQASANPGSSAF